MNAQDTHTRRRNVMDSVMEAIDSMENDHVLQRAPDDMRPRPESVSISLRSGRILDVIGFQPGSRERHNYSYTQHEDWNIDLVLRHDDGLSLATVHVDEVEMVSTDNTGCMVEPSKAAIAALSIVESIMGHEPVPEDVAGSKVYEILYGYHRGEFATQVLKEIAADPDPALEEGKRVLGQSFKSLFAADPAEAFPELTIGQLPESVRDRIAKAVHSDRILEKVNRAYRPFISMEEWELLATGR
jgi:hypothetical protein